jgi:threonine/homoserine/homoserine lactone efflux protein
MSVDMAIALAGFAFVMSISPGPGNFLLLASGANFGFLRSLPLLLGISGGFLAMVFAVGIGLGRVFEQFSQIYDVMRIISALYVLWMAIGIARSKSIDSKGRDKVNMPIGFFQAAMLQLVNPKAWAVSLIVTISYTVPDQLLTSLILLIAIFAVVNIPALSIWVLSGAALRQTLAQGRRIVMFNIVMAMLLIASMVPVLLR